MKLLIRFAPLLPCLAILSGCATSRGIIDVQEDVSGNPTAGVALKISRVTDARKFEIDPKQADIPSLKNDEINNPAEFKLTHYQAVPCDARAEAMR